VANYASTAQRDCALGQQSGATLEAELRSSESGSIEGVGGTKTSEKFITQGYEGLEFTYQVTKDGTTMYFHERTFLLGNILYQVVVVHQGAETIGMVQFLDSFTFVNRE
jgi:hypothetical protein